MISERNAQGASDTQANRHNEPGRGSPTRGSGDTFSSSRLPHLQDPEADITSTIPAVSGTMSYQGTGLDRSGGGGDCGNERLPTGPCREEHGDTDAADTSDRLRIEDLQQSELVIFGGGGGNGDDNGGSRPSKQDHSGTSRSSSGSSGTDGTDSSGIKGLEPAIQACGFITTATLTKLITALIAIWNVQLLWVYHYDPSTGALCSFRDKDACVTSVVSKILLTTARLSAGALFPSIAWCILSKCYASKYFLHNSWLSLVIDFEPTHNLHTYYGAATLLCSVIHSLAHLARVLYESEVEKLYSSSMSRSGVAAMILVLLATVPMMVGFFKEKLTYEFRKMVHLLFIPFVVAICFHGSHLKVFGAILLSWYLADRLYFTTKMTFVIKRPTYKAVGRGTFVRFDLPTGYRFKPGAYIQVSCPAINASEWHPFSLFLVPGPRPRAGFHVEVVGDWTEELFRLCLEDPHMPLWITAAQASVLEQTVFYDNVVLVCTGAGITPAVSIAERFAKKKNVHLLWLSREASMIALFEKQLRRVRSTVHLTGSPSAKTKNMVIDLLAPLREEVVAATASSCMSESRTSSGSDLTMLEENSGGNSPNILEFGGVLRDEDKTESATEDGREELGLPASIRGGRCDLQEESGDAKVPGRGSHRRHQRGSQKKRASGTFPVSVNFGRPDVENFIAETVLGTAVLVNWANSGSSLHIKDKAPPTGLRQSRLTTRQRTSKMELMSADLSAAGARSSKTASISGSSVSGTSQDTRKEPDTFQMDNGTWVVLFSGANTKVERAVANACDRLKIDWRKEYFSAW